MDTLLDVIYETHRQLSAIKLLLICVLVVQAATIISIFITRSHSK